jgi:hypothetical protein
MSFSKLPFAPQTKSKSGLLIVEIEGFVKKKVGKRRQRTGGRIRKVSRNVFAAAQILGMKKRGDGDINKTM